MYFATIEGIVNAPDITTTSLSKNNFIEYKGNFFYGCCSPSLWANALSFIIQKVEFTANTDNSFDIAGSKPGIIRWSAKFEVI